MKTMKLMIAVLFLFLKWPLISSADGVVPADEQISQLNEKQFSKIMNQMPYPEKAFAEKIEGFVIVSIYINSDKTFTINDIAGSHPLLV